MLNPDLLDVARRAARTAADVCQRALQRPAAEAMSKGTLGPVTLADYGSQAVILREVAAAFPTHRIVAEEGSEHLAAHADPAGVELLVDIVAAALGSPTHFDEVCGWIDHSGGDGDVTWAVDPIDGTKGFLRGDQYAVAIGILIDDVPAAGVLACPRFTVDVHTGVLLVADPESGTTVEPLRGGPPVGVSVSELGGPAETRVLGSVEAAHGDPALVREVITRGGLGGGMVRLDSQVKYGAVAAGAAEVYLRPRSRPEYRESIWDHAAGVAVVEHAGGRVTDLDGLPLDFSRGRRLEANRGVVATNGRVHDHVLDVIGRFPAG